MCIRDSLYTDVMDKEVLEGNKVEIMKAYGRIDVLLNAAGGNLSLIHI